MKKLMLLPLMAIVMMVGIVCSCGNGSKKQVEASEDSLAVESEKSPSNPFVGRYYKGEGNGGGMVSEMAISFLADGKCVCYSDFYKAYPNKEFIHGTYKLKDDSVIVNILVDGDKWDYAFKIVDGGKTIGYDHSDPEMGNMGMDFMTLKQVDAQTYAEATDTTTTYEADDISKYVGRWRLDRTTDEGRKMRMEVKLKADKSGEFAVFHLKGSSDEVLVFEEYPQCILVDGVIYLTKNGEIIKGKTPQLIVGSDGLYSVDNQKYVRVSD